MFTQLYAEMSKKADAIALAKQNKIDLAEKVAKEIAIAERIQNEAELAKKELAKSKKETSTNKKKSPKAKPIV